MGQPLENAQRTAILTVALGRAAELAARDLKDAYVLAFLRHVGCTADAPIAADVFGGDEIAARGWLALVDWGEPIDVLRVLMRNLGAGKSALQRARLIANLLVKLPRLNRTAESHCEVAQSLADDLGCSVRVREALALFVRALGRQGAPAQEEGGAIPLAMRARPGRGRRAGVPSRRAASTAVMAMLAERGGKALDPTLAETARAAAAELLAGVDVPSVWDAAIAAEPGPPDYVDDTAIDGALQAMGAFADLKSSYTRGHSTGVAELAAGAAERLGLSPDAVAEVRRAGYVHDVGRAGVSAGVWEKEGPLTEGEWEKVRVHAGYTERILARPRAAGAAGGARVAGPRADGRHRLSTPARGGVAAAGRAPAPGGGHVPGDARDAAAPALDRAVRRSRRRWRRRPRRGGSIARPCAPCWRAPVTAPRAKRARQRQRRVSRAA